LPSVAPDVLSAREAMISRALMSGVNPRARLQSISLVPGGNSRETWICDVRCEELPTKLVFRCDPDHWIRPEEMSREIRGLELAERAGVPAPRILASSLDVDVGRPYVITQFVPGTAIARRIMREPAYASAREAFASQCAEILARLHGAADFASGWESYDPIAELHAYAADAAFPSPALLGAVHWLGCNRPSPPAQLSPVHRDFRLGNLMLAEGGIVAVLDWETCRLGDPSEDLAWLCSRSWRYGSQLPVGGLGTLEELLATYELNSGRTVDQERLHWWSVFAEARWGLAGTVRQRRGAPGDTMEQAATARRGCRQEYNVLLEIKRYVGQ
jgi:aminoglycoside phosphotransferase (APT) family kinase protein